jgi:two-component system nitrate/nitrite response regulator NarL
VFLVERVMCTASIPRPGHRRDRATAGPGGGSAHPSIGGWYKQPVTAPRVTVLVADDHPLFREGIARAVRERPDLELVAEERDGRAALERIRAQEPAVAVVDLRLPELDGIAIANAVSRDGLPTRVLVLSAFTEPRPVYEAMAAGAAGYFSKDADREDVLDAIAAVARGESRVEPRLQSALFEQVRDRAREPGRPLLTPREREIVGLMADGLSAPAIGERLFLATATVKSHQAHVYEKLGVSDRAAAVAEGMRRGLLE